MNESRKLNTVTVSKAPEQTATGIYHVEFEFQTPVKAVPGQFVSIKCEGLTFRRPFGVFSNEKDKISILFKERGKGTEYLKSLKEGDKVSISGPFGNGFEIKNPPALIIGAGIGIAPVAFLKKEMNKLNIKSYFTGGFLSKSDIPSNIEIDKICTDDGSLGEKGTVIDCLENIIKEINPGIIYACGPSVVAKKITETANKYSIPVYVALEKLMACGTGVCRGCVINIKKDGQIVNASICKDGPVFEGNEVVWETL